MNVINKKQVMDLLDKNPVKHVNIHNFIENYPITRMEHLGKSCLVEGVSDRNWIYLASEDPKEFENLLDRYMTQKDRGFVLLDSWMIPLLEERKEREWLLSCKKYYMPKEARQLILSEELKDSLCGLREDDAAYIYSQYSYSEYASEDYIRERIEAGFAYGIKSQGSLVAWIMTHDDGAIGLLHVMESHRRKGYAQALMIKITEDLRKVDKIPFLHIEEENIKSTNLALKLGYQLCGTIYWFSAK